MHIKLLQENQKKLQQQSSDFYTGTGLHVYIKDPLIDPSIDIEKVVNKVENMLPHTMLSEVEMVIIGDFEEFVDRSINAAYKDGALYVSNVQTDEEDMVDDMIHEIAHSLEAPYGYEIYGDQKIKEEFLRKRARLHDILWYEGFKAPKSFFKDVEYDKKFDDFLLKKVGYDKLRKYCLGLFINAYAPTSLREYFATAFTDFYIEPDGHAYLKKISPEAYKKIYELYEQEKLDSPY
tara:strand:+ start:1300 stop:2004 length:705 start_codon:yes stop_codon:yes gene_type:complete